MENHGEVKGIGAPPKPWHFQVSPYVLSRKKPEKIFSAGKGGRGPPISTALFSKRGRGIWAPPKFEPLGKPVDIRMWVDSDHAGKKRTRRSRTGFFIYVNMACIEWVSKRKSTIETSVFGAEFVAMKHGVEKLRGLRYRLRMMGMPIDGPSLIYGDNKSAITNSSRPKSMLKKKCNSICYHACCESVAMDECRLLISAHMTTGPISWPKWPADQGDVTYHTGRGLRTTKCLSQKSKSVK